MSNIVFVWDPNKAAKNRRKHGVSFEEAQSVFYDDYAKLLHDPEHSEDEDRFVLLGRSSYTAPPIVCEKIDKVSTEQYKSRRDGAVRRRKLRFCRRTA